MPHSSGGGSSDGGWHDSNFSSHSSSRSYSSSSSNDNKRNSDVEYDPTDKRNYNAYSYISDGYCKIIYAKSPNWTTAKEKRESLFSFFISTLIVWFIISAFMSIIIGPSLIIPIFAGTGLSAKITPVKLSMDYDTKIQIIDSADIFTDKEEANTIKQLELFQDQTGITPIIVTVYTENWEGKYKNVEDLAYNFYISKYADEKHWVIMYSQSKVDPTSWSWEGMQGNDTDGILRKSVTRHFTKDLHNEIVSNGFNRAVPKTFAKYNETIMDSTVNVGFVVILSIVIFMEIAIYVLALFVLDVKKYIIQLIACKPEEIYTCPNCKTAFKIKNKTKCPKCHKEIEHKEG